MAKFKIPKAKFKATWPGSSRQAHRYIWPLPPTTNMSMLPPPYPIVALPSRLNCYSALPVQSPPPTIHYQPPAPSYCHHCNPIVTRGPITIVAGYDPTVTGALLLPLPFGALQHAHVLHTRARGMWAYWCPRGHAAWHTNFFFFSIKGVNNLSPKLQCLNYFVTK